MKYDEIIIGAGIVGLATGYKILKSRPNSKLLILEKERAVGQHQTGNNSGVLHSGIYYKPGSLKAKNCLNGYAQMLEFCKEHAIPYEICGKVIVATEPKELPRLEILEKRALENGLKGVRALSREELREIEPHVTGLRALLVPQTGIVDYKAVARQLSEEIQRRGGTILLNTPLHAIESKADHYELRAGNDLLWTDKVLNCAGLFSDRVGQLVSTSSEKLGDVKIVPFRGEYYNLRADRAHLVKTLIYPVPDPDFPFLGVHFTRMIGGGVEMGPNAVLAFKREGYKRTDFDLRDTLDTFSWPGFRKFASKHWKEGIREYSRSLSKRLFLKSLQRLIPELTLDDLEPGGAGVRAQACRIEGRLEDDFDIRQNGNFINVLNAPSPAATSSLAIGDTVAKFVMD